MMMYHDQPVPNNELDVIVVASAAERCLYDGPYDPDNISSPVCFAQSTDPRGMVPHENVAEAQSESCDTCPKNRFRNNSYDKAKNPEGGGNWCKEYRKLLVMPAGTQADDVATAEMAYMKVSPTSIKNWKDYVQKLVASQGIPPWAAETKIKVVPDKRTIHQIQFSGVRPLEGDSLLSAIHGRIEDAESMLLTPYTYDEEEDEDAKY
jgi:hypothetical protein